MAHKMGREVQKIPVIHNPQRLGVKCFGAQK
jgi:hypothetical protein